MPYDVQGAMVERADALKHSGCHGRTAQHTHGNAEQQQKDLQRESAQKRTTTGDSHILRERQQPVDPMAVLTCQIESRWSESGTSDMAAPATSSSSPSSTSSLVAVPAVAAARTCAVVAHTG
eukprot:scaffold7837_cov17-Tisochrysis_lutea.AAC.1